jgi:chitinase
MAAQTKEIVSYFPQWGIEHQPFYVKNIEAAGSADKITVLNYAFALPGYDSSGNVVVKFMNAFYDYQQTYTAEMSIDGIADDSTQPLRGHFNQLRKLKARYPHLRIVISIGGWLGSVYFSDAALTDESRETFVNSCIDVFIKGNLPIENMAGGIGVAAGIFDGIDIDWEFPIQGGVEGIRHNENDNDNLTRLYALFRNKLDEINPDLLLTAAVPATESGLKNYNINIDQKYLDWYLLMTYDYCGGWDPLTGHHTNLLSSADAKESFDNSIKLLINKYQVSKDKIIPGAAFYGKNWKVKNPQNNGLYQRGVIAPGIYEAGFNYYRDMIPLLKKGFKYFWDIAAAAPYLFNETDSIFYTLDDAQSIALKANYVDAFGLRGLMFWEISGDDSNGTLVNTIYTRNMPDIKIAKQKSTALNSSVKITKPKTNDSFSAGSNILIDAKTGISIVKVEFLGDDKSLGYDTTPPFNWVLFNVEEGQHKIEVIATDDRGHTITSKQIIIEVHK